MAATGRCVHPFVYAQFHPLHMGGVKVEPPGSRLGHARITTPPACSHEGTDRTSSVAGEHARAQRSLPPRLTLFLWYFAVAGMSPTNEGVVAGAGAGAMGAVRGTTARASGDAEASSNPVSSSRARSTTSLVGREVCPAPVPLRSLPTVCIAQPHLCHRSPGPEGMGPPMRQGSWPPPSNNCCRSGAGSAPGPGGNFPRGPPNQMRGPPDQRGPPPRQFDGPPGACRPPHRRPTTRTPLPLASGLIPARRVALVQIEA